mgnify:CR=1 FL=1
MKNLLLILILFFTACSVKNYEKTETKIIIIKTQKLKFADLGYIRSKGDALELELFVAGKSVFRVAFDSDICTHDGCMSRAAFNAEYLVAAYPDELLQNIILGKAIYDGVYVKKTEDGFEQYLKNSHVDIIYKVSKNEIYFKDAKNTILIKIKESK